MPFFFFLHVLGLCLSTCIEKKHGLILVLANSTYLYVLVHGISTSTQVVLAPRVPVPVIIIIIIICL